LSDTLRVVSPGLLTTIQDLGRPHAVTAGVPAGGAMDRFAHVAANLIAGNDRAAATLECTLIGPRLRALQSCVIAIAGADLGPQVNSEPIAMWTAIPLREGDELSFGRRRQGARAYVAIAGGFLADRWLGSLSTNLMSARGGMHGRALVAGDVLRAGDSLVPGETGRTLEPAARPQYDDHVLHTIPGPHASRLRAGSRETLLAATFAVHHDSNRMGYRLDGPRLDSDGDDILSFALVAGTVQLPRGGRMILLMADHQTAGGYPVIATVVSASMPVAAQLAPGDEVRFEEVSLDEALAMRLRQLAALESLMS
jgi:antagonist of KipI